MRCPEQPRKADSPGRDGARNSRERRTARRKEVRQMHFTKMQGIGNDYIYVDGSKERLKDPAALARKLTDRHFGIGSDGLILINPSDRADFEMEMYNLDGSRGRMCGNGIRCVGKYVYDHGMTDRTEITVDTLAGVKTLTLYPGEDGRISRVRVDMGEPLLMPAQIPADFEGERVVDAPFEAAGRRWNITLVSMGNPHCVVFPDEDADGMDLTAVGPAFEHAQVFPEGINTEFVNVTDRTHLKMRVWERGSGETLACGTGACAACVAAVLRGVAERKVEMALRGGRLTVEWSETDGHVWMTGPAEEVFEGEINV